MSDLEVRLISLPSMQVASVLGFGPNPEELAFSKLYAWARPLGLLDDPEKHPIFGFDNPSPSPGSPNYGYELWLAVGSEFRLDESAQEVSLKEFSGGRYAVTRCEVPEADGMGATDPAYTIIPETWKKLITWREEHGYRFGGHQWLERVVHEQRPGIQFILDLHMPIAG